MKEQFQPFYVGQEVEAIKDHSQGAFKKGDRFMVTSVKKSWCNCSPWVITVGIPSTTARTKCRICRISVVNSAEWPFVSSIFRAITPAFQSIAFEKVIEENPVSTC